MRQVHAIPESSRLVLSPAVAAALREGAQAMPAYDDGDLYQVRVQEALADGMRGGARGALDEVVERVRVVLDTSPHFVVLSGVPREDAERIFVGLSAALGELVEPYRQPWSRVVRHILPGTDRVVEKRPLNEWMHTDGTDWTVPNDLTCLLCIEPDDSGEGRSLLIEGAALREAFTARWGGLVEALERPVPWRLAEEFGGGIVYAPVFQQGRVRWLRYTIDLALQEGHSCPEETQTALLALEQVSEQMDAFEHALGAGDILIVANKRSLHARTAIARLSQSRRSLRRTKVMMRARSGEG